MNSKGLTLVELLVYVTLFGIISLFITKQVMQLSGNYADTRKMTKMQMGSRDILAAISRDIKNTGLKKFLSKNGTGNLTIEVKHGAVHATDSSSFMHREGNPGDTLTIYKIFIDDNGDYKSLDTLNYYLEGTGLKRSLGKSGKNSVTIAENIHALQFLYGVFAVDKLLLDQKTVDPDKWDVPAFAGKSGAMSVTVPFNNYSGSIECGTTFKIEKMQRIQTRFIVSASGGFPDNLDSIKLCVKRSGTVLASEKFLPNGSEIKVVMPVPAAINANVSFDYWCHGSGNLNISSVEVRRSDIGEYIWVNNPDPLLKKAVKAIRIIILVRGPENRGSGSDQNVTVGNVNINTSGQFIWRVLNETVEIINNGAF